MFLLQASKHSTPSKQLVEFVPPPPMPEEEVTAKMTDEPNSPAEQSLSRIIEVCWMPQAGGSELVIVPLEVSEDVGTNAGVTDEVSQNRCLKVEA